MSGGRITVTGTRSFAARTACSAASLLRRTGSLAGGDIVRYGLAVVARADRGQGGHVDEPAQTSRASAAARRFLVPSVLTAKNSAELRALTRPATWMTASTPQTAESSEARSSMAPAANSTPGSFSRIFLSERGLTSARTVCPRAERPSATYEPRKPDPPVTRTRTARHCSGRIGQTWLKANPAGPLGFQGPGRKPSEP